MGGRGSGRQPSFSTSKCEDYHAIDIAWLRRNGVKPIGYHGKVTWSRGGNRTGWIQYRVEVGGLRLTYRTRPWGGEWQDVDELIPFTYTDTNYGGRRQWFACPSCHRRCRVIYGGSYFRCRRCHGLQYESQYEPGYARAASQVHKLRDKLGYSGSIEDPFPPKPKGMHWKTYERLRSRDERLQQSWAIGCSGWLQQLRSS